MMRTVSESKDVYEPLRGVLKAVDFAAEMAIANVADRYREGDRAGYEISSRVAAAILDIQLGARTVFAADPQHAAPEKNPWGEDASAKAVSAGSFTPSEGYCNHLLLGFALHGGRCLFRAAQDVMWRAMDLDGVLLTSDRERTQGTLRPRYLAQSGSHRVTMRRRGLIQLQPDKTDTLTPKGKAVLETWLASRGRSLDDYKQIAPPIQPPTPRGRRPKSAVGARTQKSETK